MNVRFTLYSVFWLVCLEPAWQTSKSVHILHAYIMHMQPKCCLATVGSGDIRFVWLLTFLAVSLVTVQLICVKQSDLSRDNQLLNYLL